MNKKYSEIVNFQHVVRMKLYGDDSVILSFVNGSTRNYDFKTSEEAQDMMKHFESWCVWGSSIVTPAFVVYNGDLSEKL